MKVFNVDIDRDLWHRLEVRAAVQGKLIRDLVSEALESALDDSGFEPLAKLTSTDFIRKNVRIPNELWSRTHIAAARLNISRRTYLSSALLASMASSEVYNIGDDLIIITPQKQKDPRLLDWLKEIMDKP